MRIYLSFFLLFVLYNTKAQFPFEIEGIVPVSLNGQKIQLRINDSYSENKYRLSDSVIVKKGNFYFKGVIKKECEEASIFINNTHCLFQFVVDSGKNIIQAFPVLKSSSLYKNKLSNSVVANSISNVVRKKIDSVVNYYYLNFGKPSKANKNILELTKDEQKAIRLEKIKVIKQYPGCYYSLIQLYLLSKQLSLGSSTILDIYYDLDQKLKASQLGLELYKKMLVKKTSEVGSLVSSIQLKDTSGNIISNKLLAGKVYLLVFGATWCKPCIENYPRLKALYSDNRSKGFEIFDVNIDNDEKKWKKLIRESNLDWINVSENTEWKKSQVVKVFNIGAIPYYILIDREGKIIYNSFQSEGDEFVELKKRLKEVL